MGSFTYATVLKCSRCGVTYSLNRLFTCVCDGVLTVEYDWKRLKEDFTFEGFGKGRTLIERFRWFLPVKNPELAVSLGEGNTPLLKSRRLGEKLGLRSLYFKDETRNPTGSFKDRAISVGVTIARERGVKTVVIASTGNAATSLAAYSTVAGFKCVVLVPEGASPAKLTQVAMYGAKIVAVKGTVDAALGLLKAANEKWGWTPMPTSAAYNPLQVEGAKTSSYEVYQALKKPPDCMVVPVGGGDNLYAMEKGFKDLLQLGLIDTLPRMIGVQAAESAPLVKAFEARSDEIKAVDQPVTVASGIRVGYPPTGFPALRAIKETGGHAVAVEDEKTLEALKSLARLEGVFAEPSGAIAVAALNPLIEDRLIDRDEKVVCVLTGHGLKEVEALKGLWAMPEPIEASIEALEKAVKSS
ncbi:MAG: threonine synthase [Candidatus Bathyarchaeia archaeon]